MVRLVLSLTPHFRSGPACSCPNSFLTNLSNPRYGDKPYTQLQGIPIQPLGHLSARKTFLCRPNCSGQEAKG